MNVPPAEALEVMGVVVDRRHDAVQRLFSIRKSPSLSYGDASSLASPATGASRQIRQPAKTRKLTAVPDEGGTLIKALMR